MKKIFIIIVLMFFPAVVSAEAECPFGEVNDPYPGDCARFVDKNYDSICDLSEEDHEANHELLNMTVIEAADYYKVDKNEFRAQIAKYLGIAVAESNLLQDLHDEQGLCLEVITSIAEDILSREDGDIVVASGSTEEGAIYSFFPVTIVLTVIYLFGLVLVRQKKISIIIHRRFWNIVLLVSFLWSSILGIILILRINYGWFEEFYAKALYGHVETGIVMVVVSIFHILWHMDYFRCYFKKTKNKKEC